mmetsp:Transcript_31326/g.45828  ORF Transcript_31326/g.45828 Transcript_31326/m.45828 type:complete len:108 (+) Transcript_31326:672-995(+)
MHRRPSKTLLFLEKTLLLRAKMLHLLAKTSHLLAKTSLSQVHRVLCRQTAIKNAGDGPPGSVCTPVWKKKVDCVHSLKTFSAGGSGVMDNQHYYMVAAWSQCGYLHK